MTHIKCVKRHGLFNVGEIYEIKQVTQWGGVEFKMLPSFTANPMLFVDSDGQPDNGKDWQKFEPVT